MTVHRTMVNETGKSWVDEGQIVWAEFVYEREKGDLRGRREGRRVKHLLHLLLLLRHRKLVHTGY